MKKLLAMLLVLMMLATSGVLAENAAQEPEHIVFWVQGYTTYVDGNVVGQDAVVAAMNEYAKEKINVTFEFIHSDNLDKLKLELATSDKIDMFWSGAGASKLWNSIIRQDAVMDITDLLPNYPALVESIPEIVWESTEYDGRRYLIPVMKESFTGGTYIIPKAMADKVKAATGIDVEAIEVNSVRDLGNLTDYLQAVIDVDPTALAVVKSFTFSALMGYDPVYNLVSQGVGLDKTTGKIIDLYATQEYADYLALMYDWNQRGFFHDELAVGSLSSNIMNPYRNSGNYGITNWATTPDNLNNAAVRYQGVEVYGKEIGERQTGSNSMLGSDYAISAKSDNPEACLKLIELLLTDPVMGDLFAYGIEGVNYTRNADGSVTKIADSGYTYEVWMATSVFNASLTDLESANKKELYAADNAAAVAAPTMGFRFNSENVSAESSALSNVASQYTHLLEYGFYDPAEYLPSFLADRQAAGVDKLIAEMQAQYDAWLLTK